eukprot:ANDGO_00131.mRNA.1 hypothetical protein
MPTSTPQSVSTSRCTTILCSSSSIASVCCIVLMLFSQKRCAQVSLLLKPFFFVLFFSFSFSHSHTAQRSFNLFSSVSNPTTMTYHTADAPIIRQPDNDLVANDNEFGSAKGLKAAGLSVKAQLAQTLDSVQNKAKSTAVRIRNKANQTLPAVKQMSTQFSPLHSREATDAVGPAAAADVQAGAMQEKETFERFALFIRSSLMKTWNFTREQLDFAVRVAWESFLSLRNQFQLAMDEADGKIVLEKKSFLGKWMPAEKQRARIGMIALQTALFIVALAITRKLLLQFVFRKGAVFRALLRAGQFQFFISALRSSISAVFGKLNIFSGSSLAQSANLLIQKSSDISDAVTDNVMDKMAQAGAVGLSSAATAAAGASKSISKVHGVADSLAFNLSKKATKAAAGGGASLPEFGQSALMSASKDAIASGTSWVPSAGQIAMKAADILPSATLRSK